MMLSRRIETTLILRRANRKISEAKAEQEERAYLNRPHVQSAHMIGHFIPPKAPTARDCGITRRYVAGLFVMIGAVVALNVYYPEVAHASAGVCFQTASK